LNGGVDQGNYKELEKGLEVMELRRGTRLRNRLNSTIASKSHKLSPSSGGELEQVKKRYVLSS